MRSTEAGSAGIARTKRVAQIVHCKRETHLDRTAPFAREAGTVELVRETTDVIERLLSGPRSQSVPHPSSYHRMFRQALGNRGGKAEKCRHPHRQKIEPLLLPFSHRFLPTDLEGVRRARHAWGRWTSPVKRCRRLRQAGGFPATDRARQRADPGSDPATTLVPCSWRESGGGEWRKAAP